MKMALSSTLCDVSELDEFGEPEVLSPIESTDALIQIRDFVGLLAHSGMRLDRWVSPASLWTGSRCCWKRYRHIANWRTTLSPSIGYGHKPTQ